VPRTVKSKDIAPPVRCMYNIPSEGVKVAKPTEADDSSKELGIVLTKKLIG